MRRSLLQILQGKPKGDGRTLTPVRTGDEVADYYDTKTGIYLQTTGAFIQAFRSEDTNALMTYMVASMSLHDGMKILDAGCGVGAPAIWIARHFPQSTITCVTNSQKQFDLASDSVRQAELGARITVIFGDYHFLDDIVTSSTFDRVIFLESLGHNRDLNRVMEAVGNVLKPGGSVYIKDFFQRQSSEKINQDKIQNVIELINKNYAYNVMHLSALIARMEESAIVVNYVRTLDLVADIAITKAFEDAAGCLTYPAFLDVHAVDWFEVLATRV